MQKSNIWRCVENIGTRYDGLQIVYCASIKHSKEVAEAFRESGIAAIHFDGCTPADERRNIVSNFRSGKIKVLCNVDLVGEGFDVPGLLVLHSAQANGINDSVYPTGRARVETTAGTKPAIILDHVGNYTEARIAG